MIASVLSRASSALLLCAALACGGDDSKDPAADDKSEDAGDEASSKDDAAPAKTGPVEYENSIDGLTRLFDDLVVSLLADDREAQATRLTHSLGLPNHEEWMVEHFGKTRAKRLNKQYALMAEDIGSLGVTLRALVKTDQTKVKVDRFTKADDPGAVGYQVKAIELSKKPLELYSVRLTDEDKKVFHVWSFVHEDGTFRYVGKLRELLTDKQRTISPVSKHDTLEFTAEDAARIMAVESPADAGPP